MAQPLQNMQPHRHIYKSDVNSGEHAEHSKLLAHMTKEALWWKLSCWLAKKNIKNWCKN